MYMCACHINSRRWRVQRTFSDRVCDPSTECSNRDLQAAAAAAAAASHVIRPTFSADRRYTVEYNSVPCAASRVRNLPIYAPITVSDPDTVSISYFLIAIY